jgi:hypothetical protein
MNTQIIYVVSSNGILITAFNTKEAARDYISKQKQPAEYNYAGVMLITLTGE